MRFRSYLDGERALPRPGDLDGGPGGAGLRHRAGVRRVHAVSRHPRLHRPLDGAHPPLAGALPALARPSTGPRGQAVYGIVQGGVEHDLRIESAGHGRRQRLRRDRDRRLARPGQGADVRGRGLDARPSSSGSRPSARATCSGSATIDDLIAGVELGIDTFDCAMPTRLGRHGVALVPDPGRAAGGVDLVKSRWRSAARADPRRLPVPGLLGRLLPRLPALPAARPRADRRCGW